MSRAVGGRRAERVVRRRSKMVYCRMGFMTRIRAGRTPAKRAVGPSLRRRVRRVERVEGRFGGAEVDGAGRSVEGDSGEDCRAVMRVFMTQIGFVIRTVAEPAVAPQSMDSRVVSFWEVRDARWAARWRKLRVDSYPGEGDQLSSVSGILWDGGRGGGEVYSNSRRNSSP